VTTLKPGPFVDNLYKKPATDFNKLRQIAFKFMQLEELCNFHNQVKAKSNADKEKRKEKFGS